MINLDLKERTCCFFGHRDIEVTDELVNCITKTVEWLITDKDINTFLFGSRSDFDSICLKVVTELKKKYHSIVRIYVRAEFPYINEDYVNHLLKFYDYTYFPEHMINAGRAAYVERNHEMIDKSSFCVFYCDGYYISPEKENVKRPARYQPRSGTKLAYDYAVKKEKQIINIKSGYNKENF